MKFINYLLLLYIAVGNLYLCMAQLPPIPMYTGLQVRYQKCNGCNTSAAEDNGGPFTYGAITPFATEHISSDYDMRDAGPGATIWHRGIDYSADGGNNLHKNLQETKQKSGITNT
jgi:hypothetical protein